MADSGSWQRYNRDASISITVLGIFFVGLRFLSRHFGKVPLGLEDALIVAALFNLFVIFVLDLAMVKYGLGLHQTTIPSDDVVTINKLLLPAEVFYCTSLILTKTSILAMYHRIFHIHQPTRIAVYVLGAITIIRAVSLIIASIFQCIPVARAWDKSHPGRCINLKDTFIANDVVNAITDVVILVLLISRVWKVQAGWGVRISAVGMISLGSFNTLGRSNAWCVIEVSSGIISACLPTLRPLARALFPRVFSRKQSSQGQGNSSYPKPGNGGLSGDSSRDRLSKRPDMGVESDGDEYPLTVVKVKGTVEGIGFQ
ncbi:uncharacterized protein BO88DRAFT_476040 [Aspergillus vadensis CBS 113365]|uniref:Rhodopsin domain-containing protein n=1 Tax=Aspergillus vadensis (strain CBS 113365 / IMI 142717 / IBT 24658) TaxID=1448311 RepID=A0A319AVA4_ASPVC|nr:hypothetical protein BO88DRAFT_476040 [Aspergillus vadensis CBS 113365]PYH63635.1 hypothetical protein BO88DRAFT_476040 [Aspergillus vadensis CBS 113365]